MHYQHVCYIIVIITNKTDWRLYTQHSIRSSSVHWWYCDDRRNSTQKYTLPECARVWTYVCRHRTTLISWRSSVACAALPSVCVLAALRHVAHRIGSVGTNVEGVSISSRLQMWLLSLLSRNPSFHIHYSVLLLNKCVYTHAHAVVSVRIRWRMVQIMSCNIQ